MKAQNELITAVESYGKGNKDEFNRIYALSHKYLYVCIMHIVKNEETAGDMLQETYLEVSRNISQLKNAEDFLNWAAVIAKRKCFAYLKQSDRLVLTGEGEDGQEFFDSIADDEAFIPESVMQDKEKRRLMKEIIDGLSDMQRLCVIGYYYNEQRQEEIAEELGIPVNTVKSHLNRAKGKIKKEVLALEKEKGTKLYAIAPFMLLFFAEEAQACETVPMAETLMKLLGKPDAAVKGTGKMNARFGRLAQVSMKTKVIIGIVAAAGIVFIAREALLGSEQDVKEGTVAEEAKEMDEAAVEASDEALLETLDEETEEDAVEEVTETEEDAMEETAETMEEPEQEIPAGEEEGEESQEGAELAISGLYDGFGFGRDGIIVAVSGGKGGLVTYDNRVLVPIEYEYASMGPNDDGQTFFGNEGDFRVFDREGNEIFRTDKPIKAVSDGVVLWVQAGEYDEEPYNFGYVKLDGTVLYESSGEDAVGMAGAVGFNEGYAFSSNGDVGTEYKISLDGTTQDVMEERTFLKPEPVELPESNIWVNGASDYYASLSFPIGACYQGYYVDMGIPLFEDTNGTFDIWDEEGTEEYLLRMKSVADYAGFSWGEDDLRWGLTGFFHNGNYCYSDKTIVSAYITRGGEDKAFLIDTAKLEKDADWDVSGAAVLFQGEYAQIDENDYWLVKQDGQWGYVDHNGKVAAMFDAAAQFSHGKAMVMKDGYACFVDEEMNMGEWKIPAQGIVGCGDVYVVETPEGQKCFTTADWKNER